MFLSVLGHSAQLQLSLSPSPLNQPQELVFLHNLLTALHPNHPFFKKTITSETDCLEKATHLN